MSFAPVQPALPHQPDRTRHTAAAIVAFLLGVYLLITGGHVYAIDEEIMSSVTDKLVRYGSFDLNAGTGADSVLYGQYGPAQSIAAIPLYLVGQAIALGFPSEAGTWIVGMALSWFNPLVTALVGAMLYLAVLRLGYSQRAGIGAALVYGLGTMALPHSKTFFAEPLTTLMVFGSLLALLTVARGGVRGRAARWFFLAGLLAGLAPTAKIQAGLSLPLLGLYALAVAWERRSSLRSVFGWCAAFGLGALMPLALLAWYQTALFGSPLSTGYGLEASEGFTAPFWEGFSGQLWSFGRGILWYAPALMLSPLGFWLLWRRHAREALLCMLVFAAHVLFYATWWAWDGAGSWGPRFLNVTLPFMVLPLAALLDWRVPPRWLRRGVFVALAALTLPVQLAGVLINMNAFFSLTRGQELSYYRLADSAIVGHWKLALDYVQRSYELTLAPASVALRQGFSYSEGGGAQLPRWTQPEAVLELRPLPGRELRVVFQIDSCAARDANAPVGIQVGNGAVAEVAVCPERVYTLLLPAQPTIIRITTPGWDAAERGERLGVLMRHVAASVDGRALALRGDMTPISPMPAEGRALRQWMSDHRFAHWDFWWWYAGHTPYPQASIRMLTAVWAGAAIGLLLLGGAMLTHLWSKASV